jgi:SAM-dependent methyltransferase
MASAPASLVSRVVRRARITYFRHRDVFTKLKDLIAMSAQNSGKAAQSGSVAAPDATDLWNDRYASGGGTVTEISTVGDPSDYMTYPFIWRLAAGRRLTGRMDANPNDELALTFMVPPIKKMLAIGSGLASSEEWYVACGYVEHCTAFEMSEVAVERAKERLKAAGLAEKLDMRAGDVRKAGLMPGTFDCVFVQAAIHHFFDIEDMFAFMHSMLKPGGIIVYDEYVGPDHMILEDKTLDLMDEINACLDPNYRRHYITGEVRDTVERPTREQMIAFDPSEAVHSSQILPLTYRYFDVLQRKDYGGLVLRPFLTGILQNFNFDTNRRDETVARLLVLIEDLLHRYKVIPHGHTRVVARRRENPRPPFSSEEQKAMHFEGWKPADER